MSKKDAEVNAEQTELEQEETVVDAVDAEDTTDPKEQVVSLKQMEEEKSKVQSAFEKKLALQKKEREGIEARLSDMEKQLQLETYRRKQAESEQETRFLAEIEGLPEGQKISALYRKLKEREERLEGLERMAGEKYNAGEYGLKVSHAHKFAEEYGVDWKALIDAKDEKSMEALALKMKAEKLEEELKAVKEGKPKAKEGVEEMEGKTPAHIDSGTRTTAQPKRLFTLKEIESMDMDTYAKYEDQILKQMYGGKLK